MNAELNQELAQIESLLRHAASSFPYPPAPQLAARVRAQLAERRSIADRLPDLGGWIRPVVAVAALLAAMVALGAALAVPGSRSAIADFFGLSHVSFLSDDGSSPEPPVLAPGNFARPSSVDELRNLLDFAVVLPDGVEPDAVYVQGEEFDAPIAIFVFEDYDLYETRSAYIQKLIDGDAPVQLISFSGHDAYWVEQGGHIAQFLDSSGRVVIETRRTVDRATLIWEDHGVTYRIESSLSQADTVAVAESLR